MLLDIFAGAGKIMSNGTPPAPEDDAEEKKDDQQQPECPAAALDSNACRRLFAWALPPRSDAAFRALDSALKREQKQRWNFDFETETPLPGRYQWVRADCANGHSSHGRDACSRRKKLRNNCETKRRNPRRNSSSPYSLKSRSEQRCTRSTRSCDRTPLNGPRRSERNFPRAQLNSSKYPYPWK